MDGDGVVTAPDGIAEIRRTFGNPPVVNTLAQQQWAAERLALFELPFPLDNAYVRGIDPVIRRIYCHRLVGPIFQQVFADIQAAGLAPYALGYGGVWNIRPMRGATDGRLSTHAFGVALDLNPNENRRGTGGVQHPGVVAIFEARGFTWGGRWEGHQCDPMHFQFCRGY